MLVRFLIPAVAVLLFLLESKFAMYSPIEIKGATVILVPRFLILYLIFLAIYYSPKKAMIYGLVFGLCFDVFFINIIGLYTFLYPAVCFLAAWSVKRIHPHLAVSILIAIALMTLLEFAIYEFFFVIQFTSMALKPFLYYRLVPTILANSLFLMMLGWAFKYLISASVLQRAQQHS